LIGILVLVSLLTPAGLIYKNLPEIRRTNGSALNQYASQLAESLPAHAVILSDDPLRLVLAEAALNRSGKDHGLIAINTQSMKWPKYHNYLHQQYGTNWPETVVAGRNTYYQDTELVNLVNTLSTTHPIYYLHPSFGYYFEFFYGRPHGLVLEMKPYPAGMVTPPPLTEAEIAENQTFWKKAAAESFPSLLAAIAPPNAERNPAFRQSFMNRLHLKAQPNLTATLLGTFYSHTLDFWGVEMQKAGRLEEAGYYFTTAQEFYPDNVVANINQRFNRTLRQGERTPVELTKAIEDQFGRFSSWQQVLSVNGPFDDPNICLEQSRIFAGGGLIRQSAIQLERVIQLAPDSVPAHMWLGLLYAQRNQPARALDLVKHMQARPEIFLTTSTNRTDLLVVQTAAMFSQNEIVAADKIIQTALRKNPSDAYLLSSVFQVSLNFNRYTNALAAVDGMLRITPDDSTLLANQGHLHLLLGDFTASIPPLTRALVLDTNNYVARLYRATSYLSTDKFDAAQSDFEILHKTFPKQFQITYGLGEVAYHKKDTNNAIRYYQACLADGGTNTTEAQTVMARLKELKGGKP
jgi:tetratricopeptide (TPR) repeat protein